MEISKITRKAKYYNEDRYVIFNNCYMVIDGATSLLPSSFKPTSGSYFVSYIKAKLPKLDGTIIERLNNISTSFSKLIENNKEEYLPSAGISFVEINDNTIDIYSIGDCEVVVCLKDNTIKRYVQDELIKLDNKAIEEMIKISKEENISIKQARQNINPTLIKHRKLMNKDNGYNVFAPYKNPNLKFSFNSLKKEDVKYIYLFSDGFASICDTYHKYTYEQLFTQNIDLKKIIDEIVTISKDDPLYNKYPRFKLIDDITAIKIVL